MVRSLGFLVISEMPVLRIQGAARLEDFRNLLAKHVPAARVAIKLASLDTLTTASTQRCGQFLFNDAWKPFSLGHAADSATSCLCVLVTEEHGLVSTFSVAYRGKGTSYPGGMCSVYVSPVSLECFAQHCLEQMARNQAFLDFQFICGNAQLAAIAPHSFALNPADLADCRVTLAERPLPLPSKL
jgi:hypothetical protein